MCINWRAHKLMYHNHLWNHQWSNQVFTRWGTRLCSLCMVDPKGGLGWFHWLGFGELNSQHSKLSTLKSSMQMSPSFSSVAFPPLIASTTTSVCCGEISTFTSLHVCRFPKPATNQTLWRHNVFNWQLNNWPTASQISPTFSRLEH